MSVVNHKILKEFSDYIRTQIGLHFPANRLMELNQKLTEISKEKGFKNVEELIAFVLNEKNDTQNTAQMLASKLTIGETYFWRDRELFRALEEEILPAIIEKKRNTKKSIRIWSAGSSSGEEAYSIAILLKRLIPDINDWNISIVGTDINPKVLEKAEKGIYTEWSFRSAPKWLKPDYFTRISDKNYELNRSIRDMVKFSYLNLRKAPYPSLTNNTNAMDLIFCRNVLMYFAIDDIREISDNFYNCLIDDGFLFTTASESFQYLSPRFKIMHAQRVTIYQRSAIKEVSGIKIKEQNKSVTEKNNKKISAEIKGHRVKRLLKHSKKQQAVTLKKTLAKKEIKPLSYEEIKKIYEKGEYKLAENELEKLNHIESNQDAMLLLARIKANLGKLNEAKKYCEHSINANKINATAYYLLATVEAETGNPELAYQAAQKSFYLDSAFVINNYMLGNFARQLGKQKESVKYYQNSLDLLKKMDSEAIVPESDGITAARLENIISTIIQN